MTCGAHCRTSLLRILAPAGARRVHRALNFSTGTLRSLFHASSRFVPRFALTARRLASFVALRWHASCRCDVARPCDALGHVTCVVGWVTSRVTLGRSASPVCGLVPAPVELNPCVPRAPLARFLLRVRARPFLFPAPPRLGARPGSAWRVRAPGRLAGTRLASLSLTPALLPGPTGAARDPRPLRLPCPDRVARSPRRRPARPPRGALAVTALLLLGLLLTLVALGVALVVLP